jgi:hypothetical protein
VRQRDPDADRVVNAEGLLIVKTVWATPADRARPPGDPHSDRGGRRPVGGPSLRHDDFFIHVAV